MSHVQHVQKEQEGRSRQALLPGVPAPDSMLASYAQSSRVAEVIAPPCRDPGARGDPHRASRHFHERNNGRDDRTRVRRAGEGRFEQQEDTQGDNHGHRN